MFYLCYHTYGPFSCFDLCYPRFDPLPCYGFRFHRFDSFPYIWVFINIFMLVITVYLCYHCMILIRVLIFVITVLIIFHVFILALNEYFRLVGQNGEVQNDFYFSSKCKETAEMFPRYELWVSCCDHAIVWQGRSLYIHNPRTY